MERKHIAIAGVGLIGGSLALQLHEKKIASRLIGIESNEIHAKLALEKELIDEILPLEEAIDTADVIVLAVPVDILQEMLPYVLDRITNQVVMDAGSTKNGLIQAVQNHPKRGRYVPTHPMWGTEYSGPQAAVRNAFENKACVICNAADADVDAVAWVTNVYKKIGMHILYMDAVQHDVHAAYVSHISHITSFALANTVLQKEKEEQAIFEMASGGFESTVRLAKSNPAMWLPIFRENKENVLDVLAEHIKQLSIFRQALAAGDWAVLQQFMEDANRIKKIIQ